MENKEQEPANSFFFLKSLGFCLDAVSYEASSSALSFGRSVQHRRGDVAQ